MGIANALYQLYAVEYWRGNHVEAKKFYDQSFGYQTDAQRPIGSHSSKKDVEPIRQQERKA